MSASFVLLRLNFLILFGSVLILLLEARSAAEAANSAITNMRTRLLSGSTRSPAKKTKGSEDRNGSENFSEKYLALA